KGILCCDCVYQTLRKASQSYPHPSPGMGSRACEQPKGSPRIVGGNDAENGSWPWQVSIREGSNHICGGSLIAESWVVSAAHCFDGDKSAYHVNLGEYQLLNPSESLVSFPIKEIYRHPSYTDMRSSGDIALVELETPVSFNEVIRPICLPASSVEFPAGMECWVTGWGNTQYGGSLTAPKTLQEVQVPLIDRDTCNSLFNTGSYPDDPKEIDPIKQDMICAGYPQGEKDACQGDSGGPLVCELDSTWLLAGVVSWGVECALPNRPGVYILLPPYADWIQGYISPDWAYVNTANGNEGAKGPDFLQHGEQGHMHTHARKHTSKALASLSHLLQCQIVSLNLSILRPHLFIPLLGSLSAAS
uniref:Peptidase S1 domain-containing protein n=1 Tax=Chelonoidis abingdonii TaxID=106734 RepID=A0A8C0JCS9_CHEAB